jgi:hypothetical protein
LKKRDEIVEAILAAPEVLQVGGVVSLQIDCNGGSTPAARCALDRATGSLVLSY